MVRSWVLLTGLALMLSGCSGPDEVTGATVSATSEAEVPTEPIVSATDGIVRGLVLDDELIPIEGANVSLEKTEHWDLTDELGVFTMDLVYPGTYNLVALVGGYASSAKRIDVVAGAVAWVNFTLLPLASTAVYVEVIPKSTLIEFGQFQLENSVLRPAGQGCKNCVYPFRLGDNYRQFMAEYSFRPSPDYPQTNEVLCYHLYRNTTNPAPSTITDQYIDTGCIANRGNVTYATPTVLKLPVDQITWYVTPDRLPSYQQRLDIWFSISHNGELPRGHTALPPPA